MRRVQFPARVQFDQGQLIGPVAIDFVCGHEDKDSVRREAAGGFEQCRGAVGVHREVHGRIARSPVVRWLRGRVDDQRDVPVVVCKEG